MKFYPYYKFFLTAIAAIAAGTAAAQTLGFVQTDNIKVVGITTDAQINPLTPYQKQTVVVYYDGLNRPLQSVVEQASPSSKDIIQPVAYDTLGRQVKSYLPYADESGSYGTGTYRSNALTGGQSGFYDQTTQYLVPVDTEPYSSRTFENTPLQRPLEAGMTGSGFQPADTGGHFKSVNYRPNTTTDSVLIWTWNGTTYTSSGTARYTAGLLWVTDGKDEDGVETLAFADLEGHTVLKRQILGTGHLDTYYIYNNAGMVAYVVPPLAVSALAANSYNLTASPLSNMVYKFIYDTMGRLVQKTVPAKGTMSVVYNPQNMPVLSQDANMTAAKNWNYIKYDAKSRPIGSGIYTDNVHTTLAQMQNYVADTVSYTTWYETRSTSAPTTGYYTNVVFPTGAVTGTSTAALTYAYYDNYNLSGSSPNYGYITQGLLHEDSATTAPVKGMPTGTTSTTIGSGIAAGVWLTAFTFYDKRGNPIQTQSNNQVNYVSYATLTDIQTVVPDFTGVPQITLVSKTTATTQTVQTNLTYDQSYRITAVDQYYNGSTTVKHVATYAYSEAGQLILKNLGYWSAGPPVVWLQNVNMRYNIRGQLLSINNSRLTNDGGKTNSNTNAVFGMQMLYNIPDTKLTSNVYYDGKLSAVKWMAKNASGVNGNERAYTFSYDNVNRYTGETYGERPIVDSASNFSITHGWDENSIKYDANGNIQALRRDTSIQGSLNTGTPIDELKYTYSASIPDQLTSVYDTTGLAAGFRAGTGTYTYDANGNLTYDPYKGITKITYDVLNRTDTIKISSTQYITYTYDAGGSLLRKEAYKSGATTQITDYLGGWVYTGTSGSETLSYCPMPEGRLLYSGGVFVQQYIITDPQGNARVSFQNNGSGVAVVKQENSYYGYGLIMPGTLVSPPGAPANKQLYNGGSEWQNDYSTLPDYYQSYNRNYDAALARWVGVDPMAEGSASMSVYHYSGDNPIMMNDPDGDKSAAPGSQYVDYDNAEQGALQNMYQGSIGGGGGGSGGGGEPTYGEVELELMMGSGPNIIAHGQASDPDFLQNYNSNVAPYLPDGWLLGYNSNGTGKNYSFNAAGQLIGVQPNGLDENSFTIRTIISDEYLINTNTWATWDIEVIGDQPISAAQAAALGLTGSDNSNSAASQGGSSLWGTVSDVLSRAASLTEKSGYDNVLNAVHAVALDAEIGYNTFGPKISKLAGNLTNSKWLEGIGKVTGVLSIWQNGKEAYGDFQDGNIGLGLWHSTEAIGTAGFLIFGGEEVTVGFKAAEIGFNTTTTVVNAFVGGEKK